MGTRSRTAPGTTGGAASPTNGASMGESSAATATASAFSRPCASGVSSSAGSTCTPSSTALMMCARARNLQSAVRLEGMGSIDLRERAIGLANEAVAADNTQQFELALAKYVQAIETFQIAIKYERAESVKETIRAKCIEYVERAEYLKKQVAHRSGDGQAKAVRAGGGNGRGALTDDEDDDADLEERPPLTKDELLKAEREMDTELAQLVGMEAVKAQMRKLCKQLALDIVRRSEGQTVLAPMCAHARAERARVRRPTRAATRAEARAAPRALQSALPDDGQPGHGQDIDRAPRRAAVQAARRRIQGPRRRGAEGRPCRRFRQPNGDQDGAKAQGGARRRALRRRGIPADTDAPARPSRL